MEETFNTVLLLDQASLPVSHGTANSAHCTSSAVLPWCKLKATFHLMTFMHGQRVTGKIQRNKYHDGSCVPSLTGIENDVGVFFCSKEVEKKRS